MGDRTRTLVNKGLPWSEDVWWPIVAVEALLLIGIGAFMLIDTGAAGDVVLQMIGVGLLVASLVLSYTGLRNADATHGFFDAFRAGIGVTCGLVATASWWSDYIQSHAVRIILGWGLVAWALLHVVGFVIARGRENLSVSTIAFAVLSLVLGILLLTGDDVASANRVRTFGAVLLAFGLILGVLAYLLYSRSDGAGTAGTSRARA